MKFRKAWRYRVRSFGVSYTPREGFFFGACSGAWHPGSRTLQIDLWSLVLSFEFDYQKEPPCD